MKQSQGSPLPFGVTIEKDKINFSVAVEDRKECKLLLYPKGSMEPCASYLMAEAAGEVRCLALENMDASAYEYNYEIDGEVVLDPYVKKIVGKGKWGEKKSPTDHAVRGSLLVDAYDWEEDETLKLPENTVVAYSLHVRGFTKDRASKVKKKGTFEGVIEKLPYLNELGVNQIHLMPVYEFDECKDPCNYWGYGMAYYFTPKHAYSACGDAIKSLKDLVKACHRAGVEVILEMPFSSEVPKTYMEDCLRHYVLTYHVDGFILNPEVAPFDTICEDPLLKKTKILKHDTDFQNVMRKFLKGDAGMVPDVMYWLRHTSMEDRIFNYIARQNGFTLNDLVSYNEKHNESNGENNRDGTDYNLSWNCGIEGNSRKKKVLDLRRRQVRNAFLLTILSQGTPCILAGDEFRNSQKGNNNVYCQDNAIGWVNWTNLTKEEELFTFVKKLIQIRKDYTVFCPEKEMDGTDKIGCGIPDVSYHAEEAWVNPATHTSRQLGVYYNGKAVGGDDCFVAYNMHWEKHIFALPTLPKNKRWQLLISTDDASHDGEFLKDQKFIELKGRTIVVLTGKEKDENECKSAENDCCDNNGH